MIMFVQVPPTLSIMFSGVAQLLCTPICPELLQWLQGRMVSIREDLALENESAFIVDASFEHADWTVLL